MIGFVANLPTTLSCIRNRTTVVVWSGPLLAVFHGLSASSAAAETRTSALLGTCVCDDDAVASQRSLLGRTPSLHAPSSGRSTPTIMRSRPSQRCAPWGQRGERLTARCQGTRRTHGWDWLLQLGERSHPPADVLQHPSKQTSEIYSWRVQWINSLLGNCMLGDTKLNLKRSWNNC